MTTNPFEYRGFYINESNVNQSCNSINTISYISCDDPSYGLVNKNTNGYISNGPLNLLEIQKYIFDETTKLVIMIQLAQTCDQAGISLNKNPKGDIPYGCESTFMQFQKSQIKNMQNAIIAGGVQYIPLLKSGSNPFENFAYTDSYISSKMTANDKKPLCQRYADIGKLLSDFSLILLKVDTSSQPKFKDDFQEILKLYKQNNDMRVSLEDKLDTIVQGRRYRDSKQWGDSTIYTSVLWTVLATVTLFYIFKKM
jgi:hypothetical protein